MNQASPDATKFCWPVRIYWEDTDAGGIVFYANYLRFFERARTEWLRSLGLEQSTLRQRSGGMFVVSEARLRYLQVARLDDELQVITWPQEIGRASIAMQQQAWRRTGSENILLCEASIRIGWVDALSYKPARMPAPLLEILK
ncbi:MAG: tol-pal system-associated acyl-CoA thioesterase [Comamonadaceae bacterium]